MQDEPKNMDDRYYIILSHEIRTIKSALASVMSVICGILRDELLSETNLHTMQLKSDIIADYEELVARLTDCAKETERKTVG